MTIRRQGETVFPRAQVARGPVERMLGLLPRTSLEGDEALIFPSCKSLHTFFMRFPIDIVFVDRDGEVVKLVRDVPAGRLVFGGKLAHTAIECAGTEAAARGITEGQRLTWSAS